MQLEPQFFSTLIQVKQEVEEPKGPTYLQRFLAEQSQKNHSESFIFFKVVIGKYFIQAYRIFKTLPKINSLIFWKRQENKTSYNFLIVFESFEEMMEELNALLKPETDRALEMKKSIQKMTKKQLQTYSISLGFVNQLGKMTFPNIQSYHEFLQSLHPDNLRQKLNASDGPLSSSQILKPGLTYTKESFVPSLKKQNQEILHESSKDFDVLKELMSVYMDTFANEEKGRKIYKEINESSRSFQVDLLLNTLNYIIFEEVNNSCYSQIEPCYWTCFESSTKQLNSDRKHIVLTGSGEICVLEIIFLKSMETQNKVEYKMMETEFKKFYKKGTIKIYRILNQKWNGEVERIDLDDDPEKPEKRSEAPAIIYKFDCTKTSWQNPPPVSK